MTIVAIVVFNAKTTGQVKFPPEALKSKKWRNFTIQRRVSRKEKFVCGLIINEFHTFDSIEIPEVKNLPQKS